MPWTSRDPVRPDRVYSASGIGASDRTNRTYGTRNACVVMNRSTSSSVSRSSNP
jgi:hypothetical protein